MIAYFHGLDLNHVNDVVGTFVKCVVHINLRHLVDYGNFNGGLRRVHRVG